nr:TonB-dependent receptor [Bacteroidaceae bacterium]
SKQSYYQTIYTSGNAPYSGTTVDGITVSNFPGLHVYDVEGNEVTNFKEEDSHFFANYLPSTYVGHYSVDSREVNLFAKLTANFFKSIGAVNNGFLVGVDFKSDGNEGKGSQWNVKTPPLRNVANPDASYRPRSYRDIPYINTLGLFGEYNFQWALGKRALDLQLGLRYDRTSVAGGLACPRINASFDVIPDMLRLHGGWGMAAKMPSLYYLYPQNAYFEYINYNDLAYDWIPENERMIITTTKIVDAQNKDLKIASNEKAEIGFDLSLGKAQLGVTAFQEKLKDGYGMSPKYAPFVYKEYDLDENDDIMLYGTYPILSEYYSPANSFSSRTRGVEFELNVDNIEAIRTSFQFNGQWIRTDTKNSLPLYYDASGAEPYLRQEIGIYSSDRMEGHEQQFVTSLRAIHNIPSIGFVVSVTMQAVWNESNWVTFNNDSIPIGYLSLEDGKANMFSPAFTTRQAVEDAGYGHLLRNVNHASAIKESYSPYFQFNINISKEIGEMARISFFANNLFRSYPRRESKRNPGVYYSLNSPFYFGMELSLKL